VFANAPEAMAPWWDIEGAYGHPADFIRNVLAGSSEDMVGGDDTPGWDPDYGNGRVSAYGAVASVSNGDPDNSGGIDIDDVVYLINYIFAGGPAPVPDWCTGDANCTGAIDIDDVVYLIAFIFSGGPHPVKPCFCYTE